MSYKLKFKPLSSFNLIRCGRNFDGGYLLTKNSIINSNALVSFGILDDCSFEEDFLKIKSVECYCYDHTVNSSYWKKRIFNDFGAAIFNLNYKFFKNTLIRYFEFKRFFKKKTNLLKIDTIKKGSLDTIISKHNLKDNFFLKVDIEGSEYRILDDIIHNQDKLSGIIIEFHDLDLHRNIIENFIDKLDLVLTHVHPNNFGGIDESGDPLVIEMTFERNPEKSKTTFVLPNKFDQPNNPNVKDITIKFE